MLLFYRMKTKKEKEDIIQLLTNQHPDAVCELQYDTPFELLVAVILSAQCTDKRVNQVTESLFKVYRTPQDFAFCDIEDLKRRIHSCGFYNNKALSIVSASNDIIEKFHGQVPSSIEQLMTLRGVGRKTANVMYSVAFGGDAIAVDTHVFRVSNRVGLVSAKSPDETEKQLTEAFAQNEWSHLHHLLIHHGRYVCKAQKPQCAMCSIQNYCDYYQRGDKHE